MEERVYPGQTATVAQISTLAAEYQGAARQLLTRGARGHPVTWAPARLLAMQAIELWLNAYLLHHGVSAEALRGMQHDLAGRGDLAETIGLRLRRRTLAHLHELSSRREYLITRYGPELLGSWTQINRLVATLEEVATKVSEATRAGRSDLRAAPSAPCRTIVSHPVPAAAAS